MNFDASSDRAACIDSMRTLHAAFACRLKKALIVSSREITNAALGSRLIQGDDISFCYHAAVMNQNHYNGCGASSLKTFLKLM